MKILITQFYTSNIFDVVVVFVFFFFLFSKIIYRFECGTNRLNEMQSIFTMPMQESFEGDAFHYMPQLLIGG